MIDTHILDLNFNPRYTVVLCSIVGAPLDCLHLKCLARGPCTKLLTYRSRNIRRIFFLSSISPKTNEKNSPISSLLPKNWFSQSTLLI